MEPDKPALCSREWAFAEARRRAAIFDRPFAVYRERKTRDSTHIVRESTLPMLSGLHWELVGTVATAGAARKRQRKSPPLA